MPIGSWDDIPDAPQRPKVSIPAASLGLVTIPEASLQGNAKAPDPWDAIPDDDPWDAIPSDPKAAKPFDLKRSIEKKVFPTAVRIGGAIGGGILGAPFGPAGVALGGAAGSGLGELAAEAGEMAQGDRESLSAKQIAMQTVLGAVPVVGRVGSTARTVLSRGAQGAVLGGAGAAGTEIAEGRTPTWQDVVVGAGLGAGMGAAGGGLEAWRLAKKPNMATVVTPTALSTEAPPIVKAPAAIDNVPVMPQTVARREATTQAPRRVATAEQTGAAKAAVQAADNLGFDTPDQALAAIRQHSDWAQRWDMTGVDPHHVQTLEQWRASVAPQERGGLPRLVGVQPTDSGIVYMQFMRDDAGHYPMDPARLREQIRQQVGPDVQFEVAEQADQFMRPDLQKMRVDFFGPNSRTNAQALGESLGGHFREWPEPFTGSFADRVTGGRSTITPDPGDVSASAVPAAMRAELPQHTTGGMEKGAGGPVQPEDFRDPRVIADIEAERARGGPPKKSIAEIEQMARVMGPPIPEALPLPESRKVEPRMVADLPESQRADVLSIIEEHDGFASQRRGVQPLARTEALAKGMDVPTERLPKGTILGDVETVALKNARTRVKGEITELAAKVTDGSASPAETMRLAKLRQDQVILEANYLGVGAEQGRAMNARRLMADAERLYDEDLLHTALRDLDPDDLTTFAQQWSALPDEVSKQRFIHNEMAKQSTKWDWLTSARYANILSGVQTHLKNIFGSAANSGFRDVGKVVGTGIDAGISAVTGKPRTMFLSEMKPEAVATVVGARRGLDAFWFTLKNGFAPKGMQASAFETTRELPGGWKNPLNLPGRLLNAEDAAMFAMRRDKQMAGRAYADARNEGLKLGHRGRALDTFIKDRAAKIMVSPPTEMLAAAEKAAQHDLYRESGGRVISWISEAKSWPGFLGAIAKLLVPFHKVPGNILRQSIENVPLGFLATKQGRATMAAGGRESRELMGREATSAAVILTLAWMAQNGQISGYGPSDPNERARMLKEGWQPHSVKIGNKWIDYTIPFQAIATPIYAIANHYEKWQESQKSFSETALRDTFSTIKSVLDQSFLTGMSDFVQAVNEGDRYGTRFAGNMAASFVPFASASRNYNRLTDATVRDPRWVSDYVAQALPGGQKLVEPKISPTGEVVKKPGGAFMRGVSPIAVSTVTTDPVVSALKTLNLTLGAPPRTLDKTRTMPEVTLTTEERTRVGLASRQAAETLVQNATFQALMTKNADAAGRALSAAISTAREREYSRIRAARRTKK